MRRVTFWNVCLFCGCLTIIVGAIFLAIGFGFSTHKIDVGFQEEMQIIDKSAVMYNHRLELFKITGLSMLAIGGFLLSMSLLLPSLIYSSSEDEEQTESSTRITNILSSNSTTEEHSSSQQTSRGSFNGGENNKNSSTKLLNENSDNNTSQ